MEGFIWEGEILCFAKVEIDMHLHIQNKAIKLSDLNILFSI